MATSRSREEIDRQAEQNRRKLLAAEVVALLLLKRRRDAVVASGVVAGRSIDEIARRIAVGQRAGIAQARQLSRIAGFSRLRAEGASLGFQFARAAHVTRLEVERDMLRARRAAESFANRWRRAAEGKTVREAAKAATIGTAKSLERIAATESAESFNTGRAKYLRAVPTRQLMRVWDALLDRGTCAICENADGRIVGIRESFPDGEPGAVHPLCRCNFTILLADEAEDFLTLEAA